MYRVHFFLNQVMFKTTTCGLGVPTTSIVESISINHRIREQVRKRNANE